ncbi:unnamed protein product [Mycena citricolor]|uniref:AAA+ ATPase domain-containing protein n=1 Tax=Mycena citricolor TaxID=2018698 RepID=A0AAD2HHW9_9AGAR|nr:unnamed protein product [Mycena citricolor]
MTESEDPQPVSHPRIVRYDQYFDLRTFSTTLRKTNKAVKRSSKKSVLIVRRIIDEKGRYSHTEVDIRSPILLQTILDLNVDTEGLSLTRNNPTIKARELFHTRGKLRGRMLEEMKKTEPDHGLITDIETVFQFIDEDYSGILGDLNLLAHNEISYDLLWVIYPPNTLIYRFHSFTEQPQLLLARSIEYRRRRRDDSPYAHIDCDVVNNDGDSFGLARDVIEIDPFRGTRRIRDLPACPVDYLPNKEEMLAHALDRGKRLVDISSAPYREISGPAMKETINQNYETRQFKFSTHGRIMIDPAAFRLFQPNCTYNLEVHRQLEREELSDEQLMICTPVVLGFCFGVKTWGGFAMDRVRDVMWSDEAFRSLVLGAKQKMLIHSLFKSHSAHSATFDDIVRGKGKGLIGLFSGSPGCGKTLTAEAVAEMTRRPLYTVSAGELGTEPKELDAKLTMILEIAQTWDAVLLLDEAEVFLQQRSRGDVTRNALVSIFLRQLEYYQGILILTTNLIEQCDPAFESRIHFSIHYPDLDRASRRQIWHTFISKVTKEPHTRISSEDVDRLAGLKMNGRQIKNVVSSAQCIALDAEAEMGVEHIDAVLEVIDDWHSAKRVDEE